MKSEKANESLRATQKEHEKGMDIIAGIMAYEQGDLNDKDTVELFAELIKSGQAWSLQGCYGRTAQGLIEAKLINTKGVIDWELFDDIQTA